jgi:Ca2+/H+ antiporter
MDRQKEILQYNVEWLKFAETKATLILTIQGVLLTILYTNANELYNAILNSKLQLFCSVISAILFLLTLIFSFFRNKP